MLRRGFLAAVAALFAGGAKAQDAVSSSGSASPAAPALQKVSLKTGKGEIVLALEIERAPITTRNFLKYVDQKRLDNANFYRAMQVTPEIGLIQGGDNSRALPGCKHEPTSLTGLTHTDGVISLARGKPGTAQGDFFICLGDMDRSRRRQGRHRRQARLRRLRPCGGRHGRGPRHLQRAGLQDQRLRRHEGPDAVAAGEDRHRPADQGVSHPAGRATWPECVALTRTGKR
ncbi:MAG: peptidylprolyl isomerase [Asticcacaulis sp.]